MRHMAIWRTLCALLCIVMSGCTIRTKSGTTYTWPAPDAVTYRSTVTAPTYAPRPIQRAPSNVSRAPLTPPYIPVPPPVDEPRYAPVQTDPTYDPRRARAAFDEQPERRTDSGRNATVQSSRRESAPTRYAQSKDPFESLMTKDQDQWEEAFDRVAQEYRRVAGGQAKESLGLANTPDSSKYLKVLRRDVPVLAEPNIGADNLTVLGLAQSGEYFPVLEERETMYTLQNPLSRRPNNGGKWCKIQTAAGQTGWIMAQPTGSKSFADIVQRPVPAQFVPPPSDTGLSGAIFIFVVVAGLVVFGLVKALSSVGGGISSSGSGGSESSSASTTSAGNWFSETFAGRDARPKQGFFESHGDYRDRVYLEGKERMIEDLTGDAPRQGFFEGDDHYRSRIAHESNERIVERSNESAPRQGFFEGDDSYRERMAHEANEAIVEASSGSEPKQGFFESDDHYHDRITHESNAAIVEEATGSSPKQGFFESDDSYKTRISQEAKDIKASD
jgi:hypothetical protein